MNSRFTMAAHAVAMLAHAEQEGRGLVSSAEMAASIQTNPVVVRRLLGDLARAGLVSARRGTGGGAALARRPNRITLWDVYAAVKEHTELFGRHPSGPNPRCAIGPYVAAYLDDIYGQAEAALEARLRAITVQDMFRDLLVRVEGAHRTGTA